MLLPQQRYCCNSYPPASRCRDLIRLWLTGDPELISSSQAKSCRPHSRNFPPSIQAKFVLGVNHSIRRVRIGSIDAACREEKRRPLVQAVSLARTKVDRGSESQTSGSQVFAVPEATLHSDDEARLSPTAANTSASQQMQPEEAFYICVPQPAFPAVARMSPLVREESALSRRPRLESSGGARTWLWLSRTI
jgi:hypothetical protein